MNNTVNDPLVVMEFPIMGGENADRNTVVRALLERRPIIESTFTNDEYLKLDLTRQEIIGLKSTAYVGKTKITDLPALNHVLSNNEIYIGNNITNLGNVSTIYKYYSS